jgi:hypothetical protein
MERSSTFSRYAVCARGVTAVYARWDKFDLRREMATVLERSLRETLVGETATPAKTAA